MQVSFEMAAGVIPQDWPYIRRVERCIAAHKNRGGGRVVQFDEFNIIAGSRTSDDLTDHQMTIKPDRSRDGSSADRCERYVYSLWWRIGCNSDVIIGRKISQR